MLNKFEAHDVEFSLRIRIHDAVAAFFCRTDTLKTFCRDLKIEYPLNPSDNYNKRAFLDNYLVRADELEYLGKNRDKIILSLYESYKSCQDNLAELIIAEQSDLEQEKASLVEEKEINAKLQQKLKTAQTSIEKVDLQAKIAESQTRRRNTEINISSHKENIDSSRLLQAQNNESWINQVNLINSTYDAQAKKYVLSATKKIRKKLNFTKFTHATPPHSEDVKKIIKGKNNV